MSGEYVESHKPTTKLVGEGNRAKERKWKKENTLKRTQRFM